MFTMFLFISWQFYNVNVLPYHYFLLPTIVFVYTKLIYKEIYNIPHFLHAHIQKDTIAYISIRDDVCFTPK